MVEAAGHQLLVEFPPSDPLVRVDPGRLIQVLLNLLGNAVKYTPSGEGVIRVSCELQQNSVAVLVADNGKGIAQGTAERMFEMFVQGQDDGTYASRGLGIGLALSRNIMELHGGSLTVSSDGIGRGSTFRVSVPLAAASASPAESDASMQVAVGSTPLRILLADDNQDASWSLASLLRLSGHHVELATNGAQALARLAEGDIDVAVLDIGMPGMDGYQLARSAREAPWGRKLALVAATGWGQMSDRAKAHDAGFDVHLTKPISSEHLTAAIARAVLARKAAGEAR